MKIEYLACDGITEVEEEIIKIDFFEYNHRVTDRVVQRMQCTRPDGDEFVVDCEKVYCIKA